MLESITNILSSGLTFFSNNFISSKRAPSYLCHPEVSTIIKSNPSFLNNFTPSSAILTGSVSE